MKFKTQHGLIYLYYTFEVLDEINQIYVDLQLKAFVEGSEVIGKFPPCTNILFFLPGIAQGPPWDSSHMVT